MAIEQDQLGYCQEFAHSVEEKKRRQPLLFKEYIYPWAKSLQPPKTIVDVAAGIGHEALDLSKRRFKVVAVDVSRNLADVTLFSQNVIARAERMPFADNSFSGALVKDSFVLFPPETKEQTLGELRRVLVPGGSVLITGQLGDQLRMHYKQKPTTIWPQKESLGQTDNNWQEEFVRIGGESEIESVEFCTTPQTVRELAQRTGFRSKLLKEYDFKHPLAQENRWIDYYGFVMVLTSKKAA